MWIYLMSSLSIDLFLKPSKVPFPVLFSLVLVIVMLSLLALLGFFFIIFKDWSFAQLALSNVSKSPKWPNYAHITPLLFALHWLPIGSQIQYRIALTCFHIVSGTAPPYFSELLSLLSLGSLSLLSLGSSVFWGWVGLLGRDLFSTLDLWSGTLFLVLSGILLH